MGAMKEMAMGETENLLNELLKRDPTAVKREMLRANCSPEDAQNNLRDGAWLVVMGGPEADSCYDVPWVHEWFKIHLSKFHPDRGGK